jgi:hypothetical protein
MRVVDDTPRRGIMLGTDLTGCQGRRALGVYSFSSTHTTRGSSLCVESTSIVQYIVDSTSFPLL